MGKCKKIFKAITVCPTRAIRLFSHRPQEPLPATVTQSMKELNSQTKPAVPEQAWSDGEIPIEFLSSTPLPTSNAKEKPAMPHSSHQKNSQEGKVAPKLELAKTYVPVQKVKPKPKIDMASPANAAVGKGKQSVLTKTEAPRIKAEGTTSGLDDKFVSDYINNAKIKQRATSNVVDGNNASRLDSFNEKVSDYINRAKVKVRTTSSNLGKWEETLL